MFKKFFPAGLAVILALALLGAAIFFIRQNLPSKRWERHTVKARLYFEQGNLLAAQAEYRKAQEAKGDPSPSASLEILRVQNAIHLQARKFDQALAQTQAFVDVYPDDRDALLMLAEIAIAGSHGSEALAALMSLLQAEPNHFQGRSLLAGLRQRQGRMDLAEDQLRLLAQSHPDSLGALMPLAQILFGQGKVAESRPMAQSLVTKYPQYEPAQLLLIDNWLREGRADSALARLDAWESANRSDKRELVLRRMLLAERTGKLAEALVLANPFRISDPANQGIVAQKAILLVKTGTLDSAIGLYSEMAKTQGDKSKGFLLLAHYLALAQGKPGQALERLKQMQLAQEREPLLLRQEIATYLAIGQNHKADALVESAPDSLREQLVEFRRETPDSRDFIAAMALTAYFDFLGRKEETLKHAAALYRRWPKAGTAAFLYAKSLADAGAHGQALAITRHLRRPSPGLRFFRAQAALSARQPREGLQALRPLLNDGAHRPGAHLLASHLHQALGEKRQAVAALERAVAEDSGDLVALNNLAWEYGVTQKDSAKVMPLLAKLEKADLQDPRFHDTLGWILALHGQMARAKAPLEKALLWVPDHPGFLYHLGYVLSALGDREAGRIKIEQALRTRRPFAEKAEAKKFLATLR